MCGICGIANLGGEGRIDEQLLQQMSTVQRHRGPDDEGYFSAPGIGLGFRRLAILDLTPHGHQPMTNEDSTIWLVFNGEIYNFQQLVSELEWAGHSFKSRTDSEVIIHAYEQWGIGCLERLNGMFAFAIWDSHKRSLFMARDRLGVKPFYYWSNGTYFAWSSELKALLTLPWVARQLNVHALQSYLTYEYVPAPESIFEGIQKLPAGHYLEIQLDGSAERNCTSDWQPQQYWNVQFSAETVKRSAHDYAHELRDLLKKAVARRLVSDVPLGVFLSGGIDSSSVVALMKEVSNEQPKTFSIGFAEKTFNELAYAQAVARHFDTEHHVEILRPDARNLIETIADILDEPFADASALPTYLVSRMARQHVTVALGGDGGDELFAGYNWYCAQKIAAASMDHLSVGMQRWLRELAEQIRPSAEKKGWRNITRRFFAATDLPPQMQHMRWQTFWSNEELDQLLTLPQQLRAPAVDPHLQKLFAASGSSHPLDQQQYADIKRYLADDILFKVDRMSMAVSLEVRGPLLDYTLVEFAARLPPDLRLRGLSGKYLLKLAMQDVLPPQIIHRSKLGFNMPYKNWLRHELLDLMYDALSAQRLRQQGFFHADYVQSLIRQHVTGTHDHAHKLWQLLLFQLWAERYLNRL
jgi:asparagine synthase (glutamine-hydrolysing)